MPARPRGETVREGEVGVYHCWSRCVRRAFLCGTDPLTGKNFEYRRDWICQFEQRLAGLFGIEVGFHSEMSDHIHLVLRSRPDVVAHWSVERMVSGYEDLVRRIYSAKCGARLPRREQAEGTFSPAHAPGRCGWLPQRAHQPR